MARSLFAAFVLCFVGEAAAIRSSIECARFLSGIQQVRQEGLWRTWLDDLSFEGNQLRTQRRTYLLIRAYESLLDSLAREVPEFRETRLFVYPVAGPDVLFQSFAPVFSINRDPVDFDIGRKLLDTAKLPSAHVIKSPSRLFQDAGPLRELQEQSGYPKTLILKLFDLFTASLAPADKQKQLLKYLSEVQNVLILFSEDGDRWLPTILDAGFGPVVDMPLYEGLTLGVGDSVSGRHKSILIPDRLIFLTKRTAAE